MLVGNTVTIAVVEWAQILQNIRSTGRDIDNRPAKVGTGIAVMLTCDPGAAFVLAPLIHFDVRIHAGFLPYLLNQLLAVLHLVLLTYYKLLTHCGQPQPSYPNLDERWKSWSGLTISGGRQSFSAAARMESVS